MRKTGCRLPTHDLWLLHQQDIYRSTTSLRICAPATSKLYHTDAVVVHQHSLETTPPPPPESYPPPPTQQHRSASPWRWRFVVSPSASRTKAPSILFEHICLPGGIYMERSLNPWSFPELGRFAGIPVVGKGWETEISPNHWLRRLDE